MTQPTADQLRDEGVALTQRGDHAAALQRFEAAVHAYADAGNHPQQAEMLNNIGVVKRHLRDWSGALEALTAAQSYFGAAGDVLRQGQTQANVADLHAARGDWPAAVAEYEAAATLMATVDIAAARTAESAVWRALSVGHVRRRRWVPAIWAMERSLAVRPNRGVGGTIFLTMLRFCQRLFAGQAAE